MLRNISRALTRKQALMADHHSSKSSPTQNYRKPIPSLFGSLSFKAFTNFKAFPETEIALSPTSVLDTKLPFSPFYCNPFWYDNVNPTNSTKNFSGNKHSWENLDCKGIGLALIDKPIEENSCSKPNNNKIILFGTKLRVQIPTKTLSPCDYDIKTKNSVSSQPGLANSGVQQTEDMNIPASRASTCCLSETEMELSEDYTCVITHGPNPKTTRIFDNCIIESYCSLSDQSNNSVPENFLSYCYTCKKNLEQKNDIYIYRGEKAFCSQECRYQEMLVDAVE